LFESGLSCFADGLPSSLVFVVGRDVSDAGMQPGGIPELAGDGHHNTADCEKQAKIGSRASSRGWIGPANSTPGQAGPPVDGVIRRLRHLVTELPSMSELAERR